MRMRLLGILGALLLIGGAVSTAVLVKGAERHVIQPDIPGAPNIDVVSPRDGSKPKTNTVVVKVKVHNFKLAPAQFGEAPQLGEGTSASRSTGSPTRSTRARPMRPPATRFPAAA